MLVHLIRHPRPVTPTSTCYGRTDVELAPEAVAQLGELARSLRAQLPQDVAVFTSPLRRCTRLAGLLHPSPIVDTRLTELHFGAWELRAWDDVPREQLDAWAADPLDYRMPGGESVADMRERVRSFLDERAACGDTRIALVTHAGVMKIALGLARRVQDAEWMAWRFEHGSLHVLEWPRSSDGA